MSLISPIGFGAVLAASWPILENPEGPSAVFRRYLDVGFRFTAGQILKCSRRAWDFHASLVLIRYRQRRRRQTDAPTLRPVLAMFVAFALVPGIALTGNNCTDNGHCPPNNRYDYTAYATLLQASLLTGYNSRVPPMSNRTSASNFPKTDDAEAYFVSGSLAGTVSSPKSSPPSPSHHAV